MIRKKGEHGRLHNDFNESALSPADTLDMTTGSRRRKKDDDIRKGRKRK